MKVLLIHPPTLFLSSEIPRTSFPLGLAYLASYLEAHGHKVEVLDALVSGWSKRKTGGELVRVGLSPREISERVEGCGAEVVGIGCSFSSSAGEVGAVAREVRRGGVKVVVGGVHASLRPEEMLREGADFVVVGEGEETMLELVEVLERGRSLRQVRGLVWKGGKGEVRNPSRPLLRDLDSLPFPARHLFPMERYFRLGGHAAATKGRCASMLTSRGCARRCPFCSVPVVWGCWRARSPANVVDEVEHLVKEWGVDEIHFEDDNLALDGDRMRGICREMVKRGTEVEWATPNGVEVETLTLDLLEEMRAAGCYWLSFGLEHGDPLFRRRMGKSFSPSHAKKVVRRAKELGIWTHAFFMVGWPWETEESLERTLRFAEEVEVDFASFFAVVPLPGTPLERLWEELGLEKPDPVLHRQLRPAVDLETLKAEELGKWLRRARRRFHARRLLHWLSSPGEFYRRIGSLPDLLFFLRLIRSSLAREVRRFLR